MIIIEMLAYPAIHYAGDDNYRCMKCEKLERFSEIDIVSHLSEKHNIVSERIKKEHSGEIFLYPEKEVDSNGKSIVAQ